PISSQSLPTRRSSDLFNSSTPILFYNKDLFKKAGLRDKPPARWDEVEAMAKKLVGAGVKCGFSAAWPSWTLDRRASSPSLRPRPDRKSTRLNSSHVSI